MCLSLHGRPGRQACLEKRRVHPGRRLLDWPGACWTPNTGACPKDAKESSLSQILEVNAPEKYSLSARACLGFKAGRKARKEDSGDAVGSAGGDCRAFHLQQDPISGQVSPCIGAQRQATVGVVYDITGATSNSMKSPAPDSCFRERDVTRTLDTWVDTPECNQGGNVVVYAAGLPKPAAERGNQRHITS